ncbi:MAG: protein-disulfide reductase DsbD domain-containing protein [Planctomycetota bacterium]
MLLVCSLVMPLAGVAHAQFGEPAFGSPPAEKTGSELVSMSLVLDRPVRSGASTEVAVVFDIEPDWYVYWLNPGETGLPPDVRWELPAGVSVSGPRWPAPDRKVLAGGIVDYVHVGRLVLFYELHADDDATIPTDASIKASADWLVCKDVCLLGNGDASVSASVDDPADSSAASGLSGRFASASGRIPLRGSEAVRSSWDGRTLVLRAAGADVLTWMPGPTEDAVPTRILDQGRAEGDTIRIEYEVGGDAEDVWGVLAVESEGRTHWYELHPGLPGER